MIGKIKNTLVRRILIILIGIPLAIIAITMAWTANAMRIIPDFVLECGSDLIEAVGALSSGWYGKGN